MIRTIKLTQGKFAIVDDEDFERLNQHKWYTRFDGRNWYAQRKARQPNGEQTMVYMHRVVLNTPKGKITDHINRDGLDNRKANLRICSRSGNRTNATLNSNNTTGFKGVCWVEQYKKFMAQIQKDKKHIYIGLFNTAKEASRAYNAKAKELHGEFSLINESLIDRSE